MKRSLSVLFLVTFLVLPLFATDKGKTEIDIKLGLNVNPTATASIEDITSALDIDTGKKIEGGAAIEGKMQYTIGLEGYYFVKDNLGIGLGVTRAFPTGYLNEFIARADSVNVYATVKQEIKVSENKIIDNFYFLGRLGYGINNLSSDASKVVPAIIGSMSGTAIDVDASMDNGLYWALGIGFEKSNFLVEVLYSVNYSKLNANVDIDDGAQKLDISTNLSLSTIGINVGYKFNI